MIYGIIRCVYYDFLKEKMVLKKINTQIYFKDIFNTFWTQWLFGVTNERNFLEKYICKIESLKENK